MHQRTTIRALALIVLIALAATAQANTRFGFGTIVDVDPNGERNRRNRSGFTVCYEWYNLAPTAILKHTFYHMEQRTRHGHRVYFLDGEPSTWQEALKVGRAVCVSDNEQVCWVSSRPGPQAKLTQPTAQDCWLQISLEKALATTAAKVSRHQVGEMKSFVKHVVLLVDIRDGAVAGAAACIPALEGSDVAIDHTGFTYADGKLTGTVTLAAPFPEDGRYRLASGDAVPLTCRFEVEMADDGSLTGRYSGTCDGAARQGEASGRRRGRKNRDANSRVWLQFWDMDQDRFRYAILPATGTSILPGGDFLLSKGHPVGTVPTTECTITETGISGTLAIDGSADHRIAIDAVLIGDRLLFGTWTEAGVTRSLRGGIVPGVENGPQIRSSDEQQRERRQKMRRELYPDDPAYQPDK